VTIERSPWAYLRLLPTTVWTLVPSLAVAALLPPRRRERAFVAAVVAWIAVVTAVAIGLGALGYSKLLRYVVLAAPATVLLAGWATARIEEELLAASSRRAGAVALALFLAVGCALEVAHGFQTTRIYPDRAWIRPLMAAAPP
jgi:peptidoglycan/LPS O-acetylase OafA/YrhL